MPLNINSTLNSPLIFALLLNYIFMADMIGNFAVYGWHHVLNQRPILIYEIVLQIIVIIFLAKQVSTEDDEYLKQIYDLTNIFMLRVVRVVIYCREIQDVELVYKTCTYLTQPILKRFFFLYLLFYEFAQTSMLLFGGRLTYEKYATIGSVSGLPYYYLMNFNDFFSAMIVLFQ